VLLTRPPVRHGPRQWRPPPGGSARHGASTAWRGQSWPAPRTVATARLSGMRGPAPARPLRGPWSAPPA